MGCKSPVGGTAHESVKELLLEANAGRVTNRREEGLWKPAGLRTETAYKGRPRCDELAPHSEIAGSVVEVPPKADPPPAENAAVVPGSNAFLPGEIPRRKCHGKSAEVVLLSSEPGDERRPYKHEHRKTRCQEGLNWSAGIRPRIGHWCR